MLLHLNKPERGAEALGRTIIVHACPVEGCPEFIGISDEPTENRPDARDGGHGWNPDGWPHCTEHKRPMIPVMVEPVRAIPHEHPAGCFYGSFMEAYPDKWHIPADVECPFDHGEDPIRLEKST